MNTRHHYLTAGTHIEVAENKQLLLYEKHHDDIRCWADLERTLAREGEE